ncbi:MAG TPA: 6-carboxytetrahydropterin synthase [Candidatus Binatia bacterium]|nr:6-carboxytetrahydropterin synthase [Candidatus Binatia bacterium]
MKAHLTRRYIFSASHRLHCDALSDRQNTEVYGRCNNPHGHGHNYALAVTVSGQVEPATGMVCNLADLDEAVRREILHRFDHVNLNLRPEFSSSVPTTENLSRLIYDILKQNFKAAHLEKVRLEETAMNSFEYAGGAGFRS